MLAPRLVYWGLLLYGVTGFSGLLAEQGFERYVSLVVGATASSSAIVIFTYFLGFALGGYVVGVLQKRRAVCNPLIIYGVLEFCIGLGCILFTFGFNPLIEHLAPLQGNLSGVFAKGIVRFLFSCLLILPVAVLMGASFPLIAHVVDPHGWSRGRLWIRAYLANLVGAVAAALVGPYLIAPFFGIRGSFWVCFAIGSAVLIISAVLQCSTAVAPEPPSANPGPKPIAPTLGRDELLFLAAAFGSGFIIFVLEVLWTHLIGVVLGCSVYAFSSMLLMVLLGLLWGAFRACAALQRQRQIDYHVLFRKSALYMTGQIVGWGMVPFMFAFSPPRFLRNFCSVEIYKLAIAGLLILPTCSSLATIYPSLMRSRALQRQGRSYLVGYMNAANAIGCLAGSLMAVFVLIPILGSEISMKLIVILLIGLSFPFLLRAHPKSSDLWRASAGALLILAAVVAIRWNQAVLTSGLNVYFGSERVRSPSESHVRISRRLVYFHEGVQGGITTVVERTVTGDSGTNKTRTLYTNGKFQGEDKGGQYDAQIGFSTIPSLFVSRWNRVLLIGLGTGHSAATLKHLGYEEIDVAEFAPGIIEAASQCFSELNEGVLSHPAVRINLEDGRNMLLMDRNRVYDLITIEISSIWFSGSTNLYSKEFYELAFRRLKAQGVLQQWVQVHHISPREITSAIATVRSVFRYVSFWYFGDQGMIVATNFPQTFDQNREERIAGALSQSGRMSMAEGRRYAERIATARLVSPDGVDRLVSASNSIINTDHNRWLEYATPRYNVSSHNWVQQNVDFLARYGGSAQRGANWAR